MAQSIRQRSDQEASHRQKNIYLRRPSHILPLRRIEQLDPKPSLGPLGHRHTTTHGEGHNLHCGNNTSNIRLHGQQPSYHAPHATYIMTHTPNNEPTKLQTPCQHHTAEISRRRRGDNKHAPSNSYTQRRDLTTTGKASSRNTDQRVGQRSSYISILDGGNESDSYTMIKTRIRSANVLAI